MVKELSINESLSNKSYINIAYKNIKKNELNKDSYKNLVIKEISGLRDFIKKKNMYIKYYLIVRLTYEIILKESMKNIKIFTKPIDMIDISEEIYNTYTSLKNGDIIIVMAFIHFKNTQWINIKTTGKEGWVLLTNYLVDSMKLF